MTDWTRPIDIYCERLGSGFWAEPVNALTNAAFLAAALWAWRYAARRDRLAPPVVALILLLATIGIGSFLFHTLATAWAGLADVLPIALFSITTLVVALHRFFGIRPARALPVILAAATLFALLARALPPLPSLAGSLSYFPVLLTLAGVAIALHRARNAAWPSIATAAILLAVSLAFRSADRIVCDTFPLGTHFLWHLLNSVLLALVLKGVIDGGRRA